MPIQLACPGCAKQFRVADEHAGKKVKCPGCQTVFQVPLAQQESPLPNFAAPPAAVTPTPANEPNSAAAAVAPAGQPIYRPMPHAGNVNSFTMPAAPTDPAETMGNIGLALGIVALVGEFGSFFLLCCCGMFAFIGPCLMAIPAGVGLALSMKATGGTRTPGIIVNSIALVISVLAIIGVVILVVLYGGLIAFSLSQQPNQGDGGF